MVATSKDKILSLLPHKVFLPVEWYMIVWYFLVLVILSLQYAFTIIFICFRSQEASYALRSGILPVLTIICLLDIPITFNTSFIRDGKLIQQRKQIIMNYFYSIYFYLDVIALLIAICQLILRYAFEDRLPFLNFLILVKIVKGLEYDSLIKKYVLRSSEGLLYYAMVKNLILLTFVCHTIGSFFFYLDLKIIDLGWYDGDPSMLWIKGSYAWNNIIDLDVFHQYSYGFYYAVVTLTGTAYGDLTPLNPTETAYTFMAVAMPMIIYAYLFSVIYNAIADRRKATIQSTNYKKQAKYYFRDIGLSEKQSVRFMNYLSFVYDKKIAVDNEFMENIAPSVRHAYLKETIEKSYDFTIFNILTRPSFPIENVKEIVYEIIQEDIFPERQAIKLYRNKKLHFISSGNVSQIIPLKQKYQKSISQGSFFGLYEFFTGLTHHKYEHEAGEFTISQSLDLAHFSQLLKQPQNQIIFQTYEMIKHETSILGEIEYIRQSCFFCESKKHMISRCPKLRLPIEIQKVMLKENRRDYNNHNKARKIRRDALKSKKIFHKTSYLVHEEDNISECENYKNVQACESEIMTQLENAGIEKRSSENIFEKVHNWKVYKPLDSISMQ